MLSEDETIVPEGPCSVKHRRKSLTYKRLVNSIDSAIDENNYNKMPEVTKKTVMKSCLDSKNPHQEGNQLEFVNEKSKIVGRQKACDVITNKPGLTAYSKNISSPKEAFHLFFTEEIITTVLEHTNKKINETIRKYGEQLAESDKYPHVKVLSPIEFEAFLGLVYFRGLYGLNNHNIDIIFSDKHGLPVFGATMSRNRFKFVWAHLFFDDFDNRGTISI